MISKQTIEQITSRISILDVVGEFVKLKRRGTNYLGLCPFHNEKTPSFTVSPSKEIYKCFGCGKSGNAITFLMESEKYSYTEALKWLAQRYNVEIEETFVKEEDRQRIQEADSLYIINKFAAEFFVKQLLETEEGRSIALSYLEERGFAKATIEKFQIGYCPAEGNTFAEAAVARQFNKELLLKTGLVTERGSNLADNYRGRIIFPIHNTTGKILGFGARVIGKADRAPKYINTPENEIYVKSKILYGAYFARHHIDKSDECLLVEGYTDVTSLHQSGIENAVASGGTSLTTEQLRLIKKYSANLTIVYDGDAAGIKAAMRGLDMALEEGLNVRLVLLPDNEDPDSFVKNNGAAYVRDYIRDNRKDFILFQLDVLLREAGGDVTKKNDAVNQVAETISRINQAEDFVRRNEYIKKSASLLQVDEFGLTSLVNKISQERLQKENKWQPAEAATPAADAIPQLTDENSLLLQRDLLQERGVLRVLVEYGLKEWTPGVTVAQYIFGEFVSFPLVNEDMLLLLRVYKNLYEAGAEPTVKTLLYHEDEAVRNLTVLVTMFPYELSHRWDEKLENVQVNNVDNSLQDVHKTMLYYKLRKIKMMFDQNQQDLKNATDYQKQKQSLEIHKHLKEMEQQLTKELGTVILK